jgi:hypothetical protein
MTLSPIPLLAADNRSASVTRELDLYILRLEAYERGEADAVPYVPAQTLIRANHEIARLNKVIAQNDVHLANLINARQSRECNHWPGQERCGVCGMGFAPNERRT